MVRYQSQMDENFRQVVPAVETVESSRVYARCCAFSIATPQQQEDVSSKALRSQYNRIARLNERLGSALDHAGIAYRWVRWVAYGDGDRAQQERFDLVMTGKHPRDAWRRISNRRSPGPVKPSKPKPCAPR